jgi:antitoxin (DNA-binding transcriptional repressor) of toxin-antitoxin stability system
LDRVAQGEEITTIRDGVPTAVLVPAAKSVAKRIHNEIVEGMRALRESVKTDRMSISDRISEGRRY